MYPSSSRRWWSLAAALFSLCLALSVSQASAQIGTLCQGYRCPNSFTGTTQSSVITLPGGCQVRVRYYVVYQDCFLGTGEIHILDVLPLTSGCASMPPAMLLNMTTVQLMKMDMTAFPIRPDTCYRMQRVLHGSCWGYQYNPCFPADSMLMPCDSNGCCITAYEICVDSDGNHTVRRTLPIGTPFPTPPKSDSCNSPNPMFLSCYPICDDSTGENLEGRPAPPQEQPSLSQQPKLKLHDPAVPPTSTPSESGVVQPPVSTVMVTSRNQQPFRAAVAPAASVGTRLAP